MKKSILFFLSLVSICVMAQNQKTVCGFDFVTEEYYKANPGERERVRQESIDLLNTATTLPKGSQNSKAPIYTIPVVVHVFHNNGSGNILKAQIDDGIRVLNEDFNKLNADTSAVRAIFQNLITDAQIQFRLAKIDPNGNCTDGIVRINTPLTENANDNVKPLSRWDPTKYFNVWLVNDINLSGISGVLGYAYQPNRFPNINVYGIVCKNDEWGTIGTATSDGRTATHEIGHSFRLDHPFNGACGSNCLNSGDFICDTPPQFDDNNNSCTFSINSCSNDATGGSTSNPNPYTTNVPDQLENYMGYGITCLGLFTHGQKDRMHAALTSTLYPYLRNLWSAPNLVATGTNNGFVAPLCNPIAQIEDPALKLVCLGGQLTFDEQSYQGAITTYDWRFPGATPSTSNMASPTVTYTTPGYHDVTLIVSNSAGADTVVINDYVFVNDTAVAYNGFNYSDGFESLAGFGNDWLVLSPSGNAQWARTTLGIPFAGSASVFLNNYGNNGPGETDILISPSIDMTQVVSPTVKFRLAYKTQTGANDVLRCAFSTDCGQTWITRFFATSGSINSGTRNGSTFIPTSPSDWLDLTVTTTAPIRASNNVIFRFDFQAGTTGGNNIFIDEFRVDGASVVGIEDVDVFESTINLYPNPVVDNIVKLDFIPGNEIEEASIFITDILGKRIKEVYNGSLNADPYQFNISTDELSSGVYFLSIQVDEKMVTKKMIVR